MSTENTCPQCQSPLPPDAPAGLCPRCLIRSVAGLGDTPAAGADVDFPDIGDPADVARRLPQFEILELLGKGGMGVVYKARQPQLERIVALKILPPADALSPDFVERFRREARALAKLNHPNIVGVYECGEQGGLYYFVMEFVEGANLRQLLETKKLTPAEALAIVPRVCDALEYAHEEGLVHRDIKPENLLIDKKGRVKIADFGLAKLLRREPLDLTLTLSGMSMGTLRYMAPEQMDKPETVDHRADLYSLGVVIYEMLTGETPVGRFELPSQKAQVDVRFDEIVLHALKREPSRRYQHASEVKQDVENVTSKPVVEAPSLPAVAPERLASAAPQSPNLEKPSPRVLLSAALVLLCLFGFFFAFSFNATHSANAAGQTKLITVGAFDPLFTSHTTATGFKTGFNFLSWSFFAAVVAGVAFGALWRIWREDQGKVARDPAWWRDWWKQVGIWGGFVLAACIVRTVMQPQSLVIPGQGAKPAASAVSDKAVTYLAGHTSAVKAVAVSPDGRTLVSAGMDGRVLVRDLPDGKLRRTAVASSHPKSAPLARFRGGIITPDGQRAIVGGDMREFQSIPLFIPASDALHIDLLRVPNETGTTIDKLMSAGGNRLAYITARDEEIVFYDVAEARTVAKVPLNPGQSSHVARAVASSDGQFIAVTTARLAPKSSDQSISETVAPFKLTVLDATGAERLSWLFADAADYVYAQVVFTDARTLAVCLPSGKMQRWTLDDAGKWQPAAESVRIVPGRYSAIAASRDGKIIWLAESNQITGIEAVSGKGVAFIELKIGERRENYTGSAIDQIAVTNDPLTIAVALWDGRVALAKCWPLDGAAKLETAKPSTVQQDRLRPIESGPNGPQLTAETIRKLKLPPRQAEEANRVMQKYAGEARALERRHTKIAKNEKGHVLVTIDPFSDECLELARKMAAELGGIVPQNILPVIQPGALPAEIFRTAGECRHTIELWKEDGKYFREHRQTDWVPTPGMTRSDMSLSNSGPNLEQVFQGDYRLYWTEE